MNCENKMKERRVVLLVRHGDSRQDLLKRYVGHTDNALNERGLAQAEALHRQLAAIPFSRYYCSDLRRSVETAQCIAGDRVGDVMPVAALREIFMGSWDGRSMAEVKSAFPDEYRRRGEDPARHAAPGGESFVDLGKRVVPAFEEIVREDQGPLMIVGHAGVNRVILTHLIGMPLKNVFRLGQDYGCVNILVREKDFFKVQALNLGAEADIGSMLNAIL